MRKRSRRRIVVMRTRLDTQQILERMVRFIPNGPSLLARTTGGLVGGSVRVDGFTLDWSNGGDSPYRIVGTIRDSGASRLIRLVLHRVSVPWWAGVLTAGTFAGGLRGLGLVTWEAAAGMFGLVLVSTLFLNLDLAGSVILDEASLQVNSVLDAEFM